MAAIKRDQKYSKLERQDWIWAYILVLPGLIGLMVFYIIPIFQSFYFSLVKWGDFNQYKFVGFSNYSRLFTDPSFWNALRNTGIYTIVFVPVTIFLAIVLAALLNSRIRWVGLYRSLYFLPVVTMPAAIAMVWKWLFHGDFGLINGILQQIGFAGRRWLTDPDTALLCIAVVGIWSSVGYRMVIFLAGLQSISKTYYEAASIDGAGPVKQFFKITLPLLTPTIFFVSVVTMINSLQVFDLVYMMIGNQAGSLSVVHEQTQSIVFFYYRTAFVLGEKGYAASIATILFLIILALTAAQMSLQKKWVYYD